MTGCGFTRVNRCGGCGVSRDIPGSRAQPATRDRHRDRRALDRSRQARLGLRRGPRHFVRAWLKGKCPGPWMPKHSRWPSEGPEEIRSLTRTTVDRSRTDRSSIPSGEQLRTHGVGYVGDIVSRVVGSATMPGLAATQKEVTIRRAGRAQRAAGPHAGVARGGFQRPPRGLGSTSAAGT